MSPIDPKNQLTDGLHTENVHVQHYLQSAGLCGPASLRILLSHFGKDFSEEQLARLAHATSDAGAEHEGMVEAIKGIDGYVFVKEEGTIEELEYFVNKEKLPVIIGWFDKDSDHYGLAVGDHYSVVVSVTDKNIIVVDPSIDVEQGKRLVSREVFPKIWFDFTGKENKIVSWGWYMVATMERKKFDIKNGHYY